MSRRGCRRPVFVSHDSALPVAIVATPRLVSNTERYSQGPPPVSIPDTNVRCAQGCTATSPPPKIIQWSSTFACVAGCRALTLTRSTAGCGIHWIRLGPLSHPSPLDPARSRRDTKISSQQLVAALPVICIGAIGPAGQCAFGHYRSHPCHIHTNAPGAAFRVGQIDVPPDRQGSDVQKAERRSGSPSFSGWDFAILAIDPAHSQNSATHPPTPTLDACVTSRLGHPFDW